MIWLLLVPGIAVVIALYGAMAAVSEGLFDDRYDTGDPWMLGTLWPVTLPLVAGYKEAERLMEAIEEEPADG